MTFCSICAVNKLNRRCWIINKSFWFDSNFLTSEEQEDVSSYCEGKKTNENGNEFENENKNKNENENDKENQNENQNENENENAVEIINGSFAWEEGDFELSRLNLEIEKGTLNVIVGPVGSGKSSLISAILGQMKKTEGKFVCSTSWFFINIFFI